MKNWFNFFKRKRCILIYDLSFIPDDMDIQKILDMYKNEGVVLYNTFAETANKNTIPPYVIEVYY